MPPPRTDGCSAMQLRADPGLVAGYEALKRELAEAHRTIVPRIPRARHASSPKWSPMPGGAIL